MGNPFKMQKMSSKEWKLEKSKHFLMAGIEDSTYSFCLGALTVIIHKTHNPVSKIKKYSDKIIMNSIALIKADGRKNYVPSYC